jgi:hypothetical protein
MRRERKSWRSNHVCRNQERLLAGRAGDRQLIYRNHWHKAYNPEAAPCRRLSKSAKERCPSRLELIVP